MDRKFFAQFLTKVFPTKDSTERRTAEHRNLNRLSRRCLRHEALEDRTLLSVTNLTETWKSFDFTASGPFSGTLTIDNPIPWPDTVASYGYVPGQPQGTASVVGTATYSSATQGTWTIAENGVTGSGPWADNFGGSGTVVFAAQGTIGDSSGVLAVTGYVDSFSGPPVSAPSGPYPGTGTFDPATFDVSVLWSMSDTLFETSGSWTGTLTPTPTEPFDTLPTSLAWNGNDVDVAFQVTGPPTTTTGHSDPVGKVRLYWADGETSSDIISSPLSDELDIHWNQATGSATITSLPTPPSGATHLLLVTDANGDLTEADEGNNVMSLALGGSGNPTSKVGVYRDGVWARDMNGNAQWDATDAATGWVSFGGAGWDPVVGDWNGDGIDDVGIHQNGVWLRDVNGNGQWDATDAATGWVSFGGEGWDPVVGDWNGDGIDDVGVHQNGTWARDMNGNGQWDATDAATGWGSFGGEGWDPVVGDWNGDGIDDVGVHQNGVWVRDMNGNSQWDVTDAATGWVSFGGEGWDPVVGDWNGDGIDDVGVHQNGTWARDTNGNGQWDATDAATGWGSFGGEGWDPVIGNWSFDSAPIMVDAVASPSRQAPDDLVQENLTGVAAAAIDMWAEEGATPGELDLLRNVTYTLTDLPEGYLAIASGSEIQIDLDASGYGWFIDTTPEDHNEFAAVGRHELAATTGSLAADRVDLLTVVLHEMGHVLHRGHGADHSVMGELLPSGTRRVWEDLLWLEEETDSAVEVDLLNPPTVDEALKQAMI